MTNNINIRKGKIASFCLDGKETSGLVVSGGKEKISVAVAHGESIKLFDLNTSAVSKVSEPSENPGINIPKPSKFTVDQPVEFLNEGRTFYGRVVSQEGGSVSILDSLDKVTCYTVSNYIVKPSEVVCPYKHLNSQDTFKDFSLKNISLDEKTEQIVGFVAVHEGKDVALVRVIDGLSSERFSDVDGLGWAQNFQRLVKDWALELGLPEEEAGRHWGEWTLKYWPTGVSDYNYAELIKKGESHED